MGTMKITKIALLSLALGVPSMAADAAVDAIEMKGNIQFQGAHNFRDGAGDKILHASWMRSNFGGKYSAEDLVAEVNMRIYVPMWGYSVTDSTGKKNTIEKYTVDAAYADYLFGANSFKFGRWATTQSQSTSLGNYLDQAMEYGKDDGRLKIGVVYQSKVTYHDAFEISNKTGPIKSTVMMGISDAALNNGYVRVNVAFKEKGIPFEGELGYRSNAWDVMTHDTVFVQRFIARGAFEVIPGMKPFVDVAVMDATDEKDRRVPVLFGLNADVTASTNVILEAEYVKNRKVADENRSTDVALSVSQKIGKRIKLMGMVASDPAADDMTRPLVAGRLSMTIK